MKNEKTICFITCVNDEALYKQAIHHIDMLHIPRGYTVEKIAIRNATSMTNGYNEAMKTSDAMYKVYIHQDTMIINEMFLHDILFLFKNHSQLGLLGIIGAVRLASNGIWWDSDVKVGKILEKRNTYRYLSFHECDYTYQRVEAADGVLLATQYDIEWDECFDGWHLYDTSQCLLFKSAGYEVGVPHQPHPWVMHECGTDFDEVAYRHYLHTFIDWKDALKK